MFHAFYRKGVGAVSTMILSILSKAYNLFILLEVTS